MGVESKFGPHAGYTRNQTGAGISDFGPVFVTGRFFGGNARRAGLDTVGTTTIYVKVYRW